MGLLDFGIFQVFVVSKFRFCLIMFVYEPVP